MVRVSGGEDCLCTRMRLLLPCISSSSQSRTRRIMQCIMLQRCPPCRGCGRRPTCHLPGFRITLLLSPPTRRHPPIQATAFPISPTLCMEEGHHHRHCHHRHRHRHHHLYLLYRIHLQLESDPAEQVERVEQVEQAANILQGLAILRLSCRPTIRPTNPTNPTNPISHTRSQSKQ